MDVNQSIRNIIAKALGVFWILDGLLQFQPRMFGAGFVNNVLSLNLSGQPTFLYAMVTLGIRMWNVDPALADTLVGLLQVGIGILLLFPIASKKFRAGLYLSIIWGLIVWICGEGAGLLFTGTSSFYTGAPGSVVFYILPSVLFFVYQDVKAMWFPKIAGWALIFGALIELQPSLWTTNGMQNNIMAATMEPFHIVSSFPIYISNLLSVNPVCANWLLVALPLIIGILILLKPNRTVGIVALIFLFLVWWLGQDLGMLTSLVTGTTTDPNSAPLIALLVLPLLFNFENKNEYR